MDYINTYSHLYALAMYKANSKTQLKAVFRKNGKKIKHVFIHDKITGISYDARGAFMEEQELVDHFSYTSIREITPKEIYQLIKKNKLENFTKEMFDTTFESVTRLY